MLLTAMQLAAENTHRVTASRMKRVEDLHLKAQTPGIMTLARMLMVRCMYRNGFSPFTMGRFLSTGSSRLLVDLFMHLSGLRISQTRIAWTVGSSCSKVRLDKSPF